MDEDYYATVSDSMDKMIIFAEGDRVNGPTGWLPSMPPGTRGNAETIMGQAALRFAWISVEPDVYENGVVVPAHNVLWLLDDCSPQGQAVAVKAWGSTAFVQGAVPTDILNTMQLAAPLIPCVIGPDAAPQNPAAKSPAVASPMPQAVAPEPPGPQPDPSPPSDPDSFTDQGGDHTLYTNGRFGTFLTYPSPYFQPDPAPENGDSRHFTSTDDEADLTVFTQANVMALSTEGLAAEAKSQDSYDSVTYEKIESGWYVLLGLIGDRIFYHRSIDEGPDGLVRVFEITYTAARKDEFDAVVTNMAESFGPGTSYAPAPQLTLGRIYTPAKKTAERKAIIDAARVPVQLFLAQPTSFMVDILHSDGAWAHVEARPIHPDDSPIDWSITPYAEAIANGTMSEKVMILLQVREGRWAIVDYAIGPLVAYWSDWVDIFGVPEAMLIKDLP